MRTCTSIKMENWSRCDVVRRDGPDVDKSFAEHAFADTRRRFIRASDYWRRQTSSVGRGTDTPFEVVGAPWIDGRTLAAYLEWPRVCGRAGSCPSNFKPNASVFKDQQVSGINIVVTDRGTLARCGPASEIACALRKLYPGRLASGQVSRGLLVNAGILEMLNRGRRSPPKYRKAVNKANRRICKRRASFLLYK